MGTSKSQNKCVVKILCNKVYIYPARFMKLDLAQKFLQSSWTLQQYFDCLSSVSLGYAYTVEAQWRMVIVANIISLRERAMLLQLDNLTLHVPPSTLYALRIYEFISSRIFDYSLHQLRGLKNHGSRMAKNIGLRVQVSRSSAML